jgi:hypothetical protein
VGTDITVTTASRPASGLGQITPEPYVQHSDVLGSPSQGPLEASAVALAKLGGQVNSVYVRAASAAAVGAVTGEISRLLPSARVTNSASLAGGMAGSLQTTARLARGPATLAIFGRSSSAHG